MTATQGRLTAYGARHGRAPGAHIFLGGDYIGDVGYNRERPERDAFTTELARRWNAFEEGGAVALAIEALRAIVWAAQYECADGVDCPTHATDNDRRARAALAALTEEAGT